MFRQGACCSVLSIILIWVAKPAECRAGTPPEAFLGEAVAARAAWSASISSIELNYDVDERTEPIAISFYYPTISDHEAPLVLKKHVESGRVGQSASQYYYHSDMMGVVRQNLQYDVAFDGQMAENRSSFRPMAISEGHDARNYPPGNPEPATYLDILPPDELQSMVKDGELTCTAGESFNRDGDAFVRLEFLSTGKNNLKGYKTEVVYDLQRDFLTVSFKNVDATGRMLIESSDVQLLSFSIAGNTFFYPVGGVVKEYTAGGELAQTSTLRIDPKKGVSINGIIDPNKFRLVASINERVWNSDLQLAVVDPGKQIDLVGAMGDALGGHTAVDVSSGSKNEEKRPESTQKSPLFGVTAPPAGDRWWFAILAFITLAIGIVLWRKSGRKKI